MILDVNFICTVNAETDTTTTGQDIQTFPQIYTLQGYNPSNPPESHNGNCYDFVWLFLSNYVINVFKNVIIFSVSSNTTATLAKQTPLKTSHYINY